MSMTSRSKLILLYTGLFLQSCSSFGAKKLNIHLEREDLLRENLLERRERNIQEGDPITVREENQPMIHEVRGKLGRLRNDGFLDHHIDFTDMKEHFMFVFSNWLRCKQSRDMSVEQKIAYFHQLRDGEGLIHPRLFWNLRYNRENDTAEFQITGLYIQGIDEIWRANLNRSGRTGGAPYFDFGTGEERIDIDHLVRNNHVTIELPQSFHNYKTRFIDSLTNIPKRTVDRDPQPYWMARARASGYVPRPVGRPPRL
ncbi:hypothetical protein [Cardinium endosymbiont of Sogatella furcifera]|uniref:hypothetical protein n=1 Tax=Cardinium endosymbiont of Sogatella furcifera TaxID=650378 RepID=UPI0013B3C448|nr:hypothetical protein [Cardinium endosymbiont of Sogatella furcifera]